MRNNVYHENEKKENKVNESEAVELFSRLSPEAQEKIIDLIRSVLHKK